MSINPTKSIIREREYPDTRNPKIISTSLRNNVYMYV